MTGRTLGASVSIDCDTAGFRVVCTQVIATVVGVKLPPMSPPLAAEDPSNNVEAPEDGGGPENKDVADLNPDLRNGLA